MTRLSCVATLLLLTAALVPHGTAGVVRVASFEGDSGDSAACAGECSQACPCASLQAALDAASDNDTIWLVPPTSGASIPCEGAKTSRSVVIMGAPTAQRMPVLDCAGQGRAVWFDGRGRSEPGRAVLVNLTVVGGAAQSGGCVRADDMMLEVRGCRMVRCSAVGSNGTVLGDGGGIMVWIHRPAWGARVRVERSEFAECRAQRLGGGVLVMFDGAAEGEAVEVVESAFSLCSAGYGGGVAAVFAGASAHGHVHVADSTVVDSYAVVSAGALYVLFLGPASHVSTAVRRTTFAGNHVRGYGGALAVIFRSQALASSVTVSHCSIANSSSRDHAGGMYVLHVGSATDSELTLEHTVFRNVSAQGSGGALYVSAAAENSTSRVTLDRCTFHHASAGIRAGAVFAVLSREEEAIPPIYCSYVPWHERAWRASSSLEVRGCEFLDVACTLPTCEGGTVAIVDGNLRITHSNITRTIARAAGGFVHSAGSASVSITATRVQHAGALTSPFVHHAGAGPLSIEGSWLGPPSPATSLRARAMVTADAASATPLFTNGSTLLCGAGERYEDASLGTSTSTEVWRLNTIPCGVAGVPGRGPVEVQSHHAQWLCVPCPRGTYFLGAGRVEDAEVHAGHCSPCPVGASCDGMADVRANHGMWSTTVPAAAGWPVLPRRLLRCADGYCCRDDATCTSFDACAPGRTGVLCGECNNGTVGVLGSAACRARTACGDAAQDVLFWPLAVVIALAFVAWQVSAAERRWRGCRDVTTGLTKATFAFFQCFPLLHVHDSALIVGLRGVHAACRQLFAFQPPLGGAAGVCVLRGLTPVGAEAVKLGMVVVLLAAGLPATWLAHGLMARHGARWLPLRLPRGAVYACALTSMLMLTYSVVLGVVVRLVECVEVSGLGQRLLIQGNLACWSRQAWWQWVVAAWGLGNTLFVPLAMPLGGWLLRTHAVSARAFWLSLLLPLPSAVAWCASGRVSQAWRMMRPKASSPTTTTGGTVGKAQVRAGDASDGRAAAAVAMDGTIKPLGSSANQTLAAPRGFELAVLLALGAGYRPAMWWWDAMLLLRRLTLTALPLMLREHHATHPMLAVLVLAASLAAHVKLQPFSTRGSNMLETGYLLSLCTLAVLNVRVGTLLTVAMHDHEFEAFMATAATALLLFVPTVGAGYGAVTACSRWSRTTQRRGNGGGGGYSGGVIEVLNVELGQHSGRNRVAAV